ncbi:MAG: pyridoxamine 5'-phosphate oxidase family protein [Acidimicrobiia bacterium]
MPADPPRSAHQGIAVIDEERCLRLVEGESIGRLGFSAGAMPVIFPINFVLIGRDVIFRTEPGQKADAARQRAVACFEVDSYDAFAHTGWSVLVTGRLAVTEGPALARLGPLPLRPWAVSGASDVVTLRGEVISGRSVEPFKGRVVTK